DSTYTASALAGGGAQSNIGVLNVTNGKVQIGLQGAASASDFNATGISGSGTIENGSNQTRWVILNQATNQTFSGVLQDGTGGARLGLSKSGAGTLTLSGNNTLSDAITVAGGQLLLTGSMNRAFGGG